MTMGAPLKFRSDTLPGMITDAIYKYFEEAGTKPGVISIQLRDTVHALAMNIGYFLAGISDEHFEQAMDEFVAWATETKRLTEEESKNRNAPHRIIVVEESETKQ